MASVQCGVLVTHKLKPGKQGAIEAILKACCIEEPWFMRTNESDSLSFFQLELRRDPAADRLLKSPEARLVVLIPQAQNIAAALRTRRELVTEYPALEKALWMIYLDEEEMVASFVEAAGKLGSLSDQKVDECPVWTTKSAGQFVILTPQSTPLSYRGRSRAFWRQQEQKLRGSSSSSQLAPQRREVSSTSISGSMVATPAPPTLTSSIPPAPRKKE